MSINTMLSVKHRLTKDKEFDNVFKKGSSSYGKIFGTKAVANKHDYNRFGIIISSKVSKQATVRNKIKRQIRAIVKEHLNSSKAGLDIIIICLPEVVEAGYEDIKKNLDRQLSQLGI